MVDQVLRDVGVHESPRQTATIEHVLLLSYLSWVNNILGLQLVRLIQGYIDDYWLGIFEVEVGVLVRESGAGLGMPALHRSWLARCRWTLSQRQGTQLLGLHQKFTIYWGCRLLNNRFLKQLVFGYINLGILSNP